MEKKFDCILLVDDDLITNFLNSRLIKKLKITTSIVVTQNGEEAIQYIVTNGAPDLIILDINMPIMNGFEFLEAYFQDLALNEKTKIIVLSSSISSRDRSIVSSYGIPFLSKPLLADELLEAIQK